MSLVVGYASIAWLLRLVAHHSITELFQTVPSFALAIVLVVLLATGVIAAV